MKKSYYHNYIDYKNNIRDFKAPPFILYAVSLKSKTVFHLKRFNDSNVLMND